MLNFETFHFAEPLWLLGLLVIPLVSGAFLFFFSPRTRFKDLSALIDSHLIPYLLIHEKTKPTSSWKWKVAFFCLIWGSMMLALAGPRFIFREIEMMSKDQNLIILVDLSESMNAKDIAPSRLKRALQKAEDLILQSYGIKIGLIAFAADSHMITPLTDDKEAVRHLLPLLNPGLVYTQGSKLTPALKMAASMLDTDGSKHKDVVLISDGGFEDTSAISEIKKLRDKGITVHVIGIGTVKGAILHDSKGNIIKKNGKAVLSKLERNPLQEISQAGQGFYIEQGYSSFNESVILDKLNNQAKVINTDKKLRLWDEAFYLILIPIIPIFLLLFRQGSILTVIALAFLFPHFSLKADIANQYFMNSEEIGAEKFNKEDYEEAATAFQDPYRKGVAYYKAGNFLEAEKMFRESILRDITKSEPNARYNLGNTLVRQQKFEEAIKTYEEVLENCPEHLPTKENLELIKQILEKQKNQNKQKNKDNSNTTGFKYNGGEITLGAMKTFDCDLKAGIAGSYEYDYIKYHLGGKGSLNTFLGSIYGLYRPAKFYILTNLNVSYSVNHIKRSIDIGNLNYQAKSSPKIYALNTYGEFGIDYRWEDLLIQPFIGIEAGHIVRSKVNEHGVDDLNLMIKNRKHTNLNSRLGVHLNAQNLPTDFNAYIDLAWNYRWTKTNNYLEEHFETFGTEFAIEGINLYKNSFECSFAVTKELCNGWNFMAEYSVQFWKRSYSSYILGGFEYHW